MGNIPGSPVDEAKQQEIKRIVERVTKAFCKYYLISFKEVMIEEVKNGRYSSALKHFLEEKRKTKEAKPRRPREKKKSKRLSAKITYHYTLDSDVDPYIVYAISVSLGGKSVTVYKRYKQFKNLHSKFKVKGVEFPKPSSKFGSRNLDHAFLEKRKEVLNKYLEALCSDEKISQNKDFLAWLGLDKDPIWTAVFERAFYKTRCHLWQWRTIVYDKEEDAVARLCVEEVKYAMWSDIVNKIPNVGPVRRKMTQTIYKSLNASVGSAVAAAYGAVKKTADGLKPEIQKIANEAIEAYLEQEEKLKEKIIEILKKGIDPVIEQLNDVLGPLVKSIVPKISSPISKNFGDEQISKIDQAILWMAEKGEDNKLKEVEDDIPKIRTNALKELNEGLQEFLDPLIGDLKSKIKVDALLGLFSPLKKLDNIVKYFLEFADPGNQFHVVREMAKWKKRIMEADPSDCNKLLDEEEWDIDYWAIWRCTVNVRWAGYSCAWYLYDWEYAAVSNTFYDFVDDWVKVNKKALKKFSFKFGDYLWDKTQKNTSWTKDEWAKAVEECYVIGYRKAIKCYKKMLLRIVVKNLKKLFRGLIFGKIEKMLLEGVETLIEPLVSSIPSPIDKLLDIWGLVSDVIGTTMDGVLDDIVAMIAPFLSETVKELKAMKNLNLKGVVPVAVSGPAEGKTEVVIVSQPVVVVTQPEPQPQVLYVPEPVQPVPVQPEPQPDPHVQIHMDMSTAVTSVEINFNDVKPITDQEAVKELVDAVNNASHHVEHGTVDASAPVNTEQHTTTTVVIEQTTVHVEQPAHVEVHVPQALADD